MAASKRTDDIRARREELARDRDAKRSTSKRSDANRIESKQTAPKQRVLTKAQITDALEGPMCVECNIRRTHNPSKVCTRCLGERACPSCGGSGTRCRDGATIACPTCPGTGLRP